MLGVLPLAAQTTTLTVNNSTGAVNTPVTPNFTAIQLGGVSIGSAATHASTDFAPAAGSSSIATLGTIGTGIWQGTAIADSYIASAATWNAKQSALTFSTGLTNTSGTITINAINLATSGSGGITGTLPLASGGTGATTKAGAATALGWSKNVVVLSAVSGIHLNSNIDSGGGTDDTSTIQAVLDTATATTPLYLIWDGVALTTNTLKVSGHTFIQASPHCGFYLANGSNCQALTNKNISGSTVTDTDIEIRGLEINGNGANQSKWEGGTDLSASFTQSATTVNSNATITLAATNARVVPGLHISGTGIQSETYVQSVSGTSVVLTKTATTGATNTLTFDYAGADNSVYDRVVGWNYGLWFNGFNRLRISGVTVRNAKTFSIVLGNGTDFVIAHCKSLWDDNDGHTLTNNNRDGIHMFGALDTGHIVDYYSNGDDDPLAFNTDENSLIGDSRRGSGYAISNIVAENIQYDASANGLRFFGNCGVGTISNVTIRNTHGTLIQGQQSCAPATVSGTTYLGRDASDQALASISQVTIDGWDHTVVSPAKTDITLNSVSKVRLNNIPEATIITLIGCEDYTGDRAPTWQRLSLAVGNLERAASGGTLMNSDQSGSSDYGRGDLYSGTSSGNYTAINFNDVLGEPWAGNSVGTVHQSIGTLDWSIPLEVECTFQVNSNGANTFFRFLLGRTIADISTAADFSNTHDVNGIGFTVENAELYLTTIVAGTHYHLDTGYAVAPNFLCKVRLRNLGNGLVRVYVDDVYKYTCPAGEGPTGNNSGGGTLEAHTTINGGSTAAYVTLTSVRIKR